MKNIPDRIRAFFYRFVPRLFSSPHLPDGFIITALLLIALNSGLALAVQQPAYWSNFSMGQSSLPLFQALLVMHPLAFAATLLLIMAAAWLLLEILTRWLALTLWTPLAFLLIWQLLVEAARRLDISVEGYGKTLVIFQLALSGLVTLYLLAAFLLKCVKARWIWPVGLSALLVGVGVGGAWWYFTLPQGGWQRIQPQHTPGGRCCGMVAYDPNRHTAVLFGGATQNLGMVSDQVSDTWEWNGDDWVKINTPTQPLPRLNGAMVYDEARKEMVLFGGQYRAARLNDTWIYRDGDWKYMANDGSPLPPVRTGHKLFFDPDRQKVILAGGYGGKNSKGEEIFYSDTWEWDGLTWKEIPSPKPAFILASYSFARDPIQGRIVVMNYSNTLAWSGDRWTELTASHAPTARMDASMGELPGTGVLAFGGYRDNVYLDDTWLLRSTAWERVTSPLRPTPRTTTMTFSDPEHWRVYLYGGTGGYNLYLDDMWVFRMP